MKFEHWIAEQIKKNYLKLNGPPRILMKAAFKAGYSAGLKEGRKIDLNSKD